MKKTMLMVALMLCTGLAHAGQIPAFDPTSPAHVEALQKCMNSSLDKLQEIETGGETELDDFQKPWDPDPRDDGWCWVYDSDSNYDLTDGGCSYGEVSGNCVDSCYREEQKCADNCQRQYPNSNCGNSGTACENCQDNCRTRFNACMSAC